jgi:cyclase
VAIPVIASNGVGTIEHMYAGFVNGAVACLAASMLHYGTYTVEQIKDYLKEKGLTL